MNWFSQHGIHPPSSCWCQNIAATSGVLQHIGAELVELNARLASSPIVAFSASHAGLTSAVKTGMLYSADPVDPSLKIDLGQLTGPNQGDEDAQQCRCAAVAAAQVDRRRQWMHSLHGAITRR
jgi:hypothetical protein